MKILVTGHYGFVAGHLCKLLYESDIEFVGYDLEDGNDTRDRFKLDKLFETENFTDVINLAARAGVRRGNDFPEEYFSTNVFGLKNLIEMSEKYGVERFIHYSSSSVYGNQKPDRGTKETDEKKPRSIYGITKLAGELLLENSKLDYTIIRPFTIVGENGRADMVVYKWLNQIQSGKPCTFYGDGTSFRGYTYVGDMIRGTVECLSNKNAIREDFNLGGDKKVTLNELWDIFVEVYPDAERVILPMPNADQPYSFADVSKAKKKLKWEHKTDIKDKIKQLINV